MDFDFTMPTRILFGRGRFRELGELAAGFGRQVLLLRGGDHLERSGRMARLHSEFSDLGLSLATAEIRAEPATQILDPVLAQAREQGCQVVVGIGGGSVLDAAKAVAGLLTNGGTVLDYLEVIGAGRPLRQRCAPLILVPTTAGTGAEATKNAVLSSRDKKVKASLRSPLLLAHIALVDPELTDDLPPEITASTGLDALTQLLEPYLSRNAQPLTDTLALAGIRLVAGALTRAFLDGSDREARSDLALAALYSGLCLGNAGLGAVHGLAAPLGGSFPIPHGVACGRLLPLVMEANANVLRQGGGQQAALVRMAEAFAAMLGGRKASDDETISAGIIALHELVKALKLPGLSRFGLGGSDLAGVVEAGKRASSMKQNPVVLPDEVLEEILRQAL